MAVFSTGERKRRPRGDRKSQEMSIHLRQTFEAAIKTELYPRSQIDIFVEVLQGKNDHKGNIVIVVILLREPQEVYVFYVILIADGGNYCACVNAATLALIDAGIPLRDYVTACTASLVEDKPLVDISSLESTQGGPELTVVSRHKFIDYC